MYKKKNKNKADRRQRQQPWSKKAANTFELEKIRGHTCLIAPRKKKRKSNRKLKKNETG